ncbi:class I SAM-dependent methyltransferase [Reichenbachiella carrageenanivorans]|uniref:Class I SAM-dependent methyltransferase n=1 Tax=Reichenbachiella carrageenanivorans TaxID=2979869 RepID=A0ABY6D3F8_9BACT|nr:class I SAM-dependent methyltransferase [Reichenbachiella carrageenanivorans]UXX80681.1 class I SAM-dependent methyltransferase [Reichenbachiella carrageenanivorans]
MSQSLIDILRTPEARTFIQTHLSEDPVALVLQARRYPDLPIREIAAQIQSRKKAEKKLPEWFAQEGILFPHGVSMEQCSSEDTAKYKATLVSGKTVTDLTGGFGIDLYYLSQHFAEAHYIERSEELVALVKYNYEQLGCDQVSFFNTTAEDYLAADQQPADLYFIDPARRDESNQKVFEIGDCTPDLRLIIPILLQRKAEILIKMSPMLDIRQALDALPHVEEVHVVSVRNECKELLFRIVPSHSGEAKRITVNFATEGPMQFVFDASDEQEQPTFSEPLTYLYEPNASIMKAGGFNAVARAFGVSKLQRNSHLYTSTELVEDFPGRVFRIQAQTVVNKKKLKPFLPQGKANIAARNYPMSVKEIRNKTGIKEGGEVYVFATTLMDGRLAALVCGKV